MIHPAQHDQRRGVETTTLATNRLIARCQNHQCPGKPTHADQPGGERLQFGDGTRPKEWIMLVQQRARTAPVIVKSLTTSLLLWLPTVDRLVVSDHLGRWVCQ